MIKWVNLIIICACTSFYGVQAQIITTIAGDGSFGFGGDNEQATNAVLNAPTGISIDKFSNVYISDLDNYRIRKIDTLGIITTIAGNGINGCFGENVPATSAKFNYLGCIYFASNGCLYIPDTHCSRLKMINAEGTIITIAGNGGTGISGDGGPATNAEVAGPSSTKIDKKGNIYICDDICRIRKIDTNGIIHTFAGTSPGFSGDGGLADTAKLMTPIDLVFDKIGNLYFSDANNDRIRKIDTLGFISTIAGNGIWGYSGDNEMATNAMINGPEGLAVDDIGNVYFSDFANNRVRKIDTNGIITTVVGNGLEGFGGDNGLATLATINGPCGLTFDKHGNLYIADFSNSRIRKVTNVGVMVNEVKEVVESKSEDGYRMYPNPNNGKMSIIQLLPDTQPVSIKVMNVLGECVYKDNITFIQNSITIQLKNKTPGLYSINLIESNGTFYNYKFIIK